MKSHSPCWQGPWIPFKGSAKARGGACPLETRAGRLRSLWWALDLGPES